MKENSMDRIIHAVERIHIYPDARVDLSYRQGSNALREAHHLRTHEFGVTSDDSYDVNQVIIRIQHDLTELETWVAPNHLPDDYRFFLEYCGGLSIKAPHYHFSIRGIGPMTNQWYFHIIGDQDDFDEGLYENGFLLISALVLRDGTSRLFHFFLDLGGTVQKDSVISIQDSWKPEMGIDDLHPILQNPQIYRPYWTKIADSFTEWLELVAETKGTLGFTNTR